jgi:hypothetical protein
VTDSAGVVIVTSSGFAARSNLTGWTLDTVPDIDLGGGEHGGAYEFHRVRGIAQVGGSRLAVLDGASRELRLFDSSGSWIQSLGGPGRGPGEFLLPQLVLSLADTSIVVFDLRLSRWTRYESGDESNPSVRSVPTSALQDVSSVVGRIDRFLLTLHSETYFANRPGLHPEPKPARYRLTDMYTGESGLVADLPGQQWFTTLMDGNLAMLPVPFDIMPSATVGRTHFFVTAGRSAEILQYDTAGTVRRIIRINGYTRPVTRREVDRLLSGVRSSAPSEAAGIELARAYSRLPLPRELPAFEALVVDNAGCLWARTYSPEQTAFADWVVFDESGIALGSVPLPAMLHVAQIGRDFVVGTWRDTSRVEHVRRYRLFRGKEAPPLTAHDSIVAGHPADRGKASPECRYDDSHS